MSTLEALLTSRLTNLRRTATGWTAQCPCCAANGGDLNGKNHLQVFAASGAFYCVAAGAEDKAHNKAIRAFIYKNADAATLAALETAVVDPEPKLTADKVYPEDMLTRLVPDYSYWAGRKISEEVQRRYEGGLVPELPRNKLSGRFVFPIRDHVTRRIMGWTGRLVSEASFGPTHKHLVKVSRAVYPLVANEAAIRRAGKVVLYEGIGDGLASTQAGIDYWLLLLGLNVNSRLLSFLISSGVDVVISTNGDEAKVNPATGELFYPGQEAAAKARARLVPYLGEHKVRIRLPTTRKDWCKTHEDDTGELALFRAELEGRAAESEPFTL